MPITLHCQHCDSQNIGRDSWAHWNANAQAWECGPVFDHAHCFDCDAETRLVEREIAAEGVL
jgi:hypothetical protein